MKKLLLILAVLFIAYPAWGAEKKIEPTMQTAKIITDIPGQTERKEVIVETKRKTKAITMIGGAQAKRLKR